MFSCQLFRALAAELVAQAAEHDVALKQHLWPAVGEEAATGRFNCVHSLHSCNGYA
jgi:hypothetical protein